MGEGHIMKGIFCFCAIWPSHQLLHTLHTQIEPFSFAFNYSNDLENLQRQKELIEEKEVRVWGTDQLAVLDCTLTQFPIDLAKVQHRPD